MQITAIRRFPVKSMQGETLTEATVGPHGIDGDRHWSLIDAETGLHLTARKQPELLFGRARVVEGEVVVTLPDGTDGADDAALSAWLGREIRLVEATEGQSGTYETQADEAETGPWHQWSGPSGSFHDSTRSPISLAAAGSYRDWDPRRFRINLTLNGTDESELVGSDVTVGGATLHVMKQIDRCVMVTRPQPPTGDEPSLDRDLDVLRTINRENETFLGIGAIITNGGGTVRVGDRVTAT